MPNIEARSTLQPSVQVRYEGRKRLNKQDWFELANAIQTSCEAALADRSTLDRNLKDWDESYEQLADEKNWPWPDSSNLVLPLTTTQVDSLIAYIAAQVLIPGHVFIVSGNTSEASDGAALVERYYNAELRRQRLDTTWFNELYNWLALSIKDGTSIMECVWRYRSVKKKALDRRPVMKDMEGGQQVQDIDESGMPAYEDVPIDIEEVINGVQWKALDLRNFYTIPAAAVSIQDARAVCKIEYLYESDCQELINEGILDKDEVELALAMVPNGATELASSEQPTETYTAGHQINIGSGQGTQSTKFFRNRGPIEVHRVHSNQYDLDGDGVAEENVFWWHRSTKRLLGWMRYEYFSGLRPFFAFSPFPRFGRLYGISLIERLQGLQQAEDALVNERIDDGDLRLGGIWLYLEGAIDRDKLEFGPTSFNEVDASITQGDVRKAVQKVDFGPQPEMSFLETDRFKLYAQEFTGLNSPAIGQQSSGRRSAQEAKQWQAAAATRTGLLAMRFRMAIEPVINFTHDLNKQYLQADQNFISNGQWFTVPAEVLKQDYNLDVSGASDPIDANTRKAETLSAVFEFMQVPLVAQNPKHQFYLLRKAIQAMGWEVDEDKIIGTEQELEQMMQMQQQMAQAQAAAGIQPQTANNQPNAPRRPQRQRQGGGPGTPGKPGMGGPA